jgi:hypothetical protein
MSSSLRTFQKVAHFRLQFMPIQLLKKSMLRFTFACLSTAVSFCNLGKLSVLVCLPFENLLVMTVQNPVPTPTLLETFIYSWLILV